MEVEQRNAEEGFAFRSSRFFPDVLRIRNRLARECLTEFLCSFLFLLIGIGTTVQIKAVKGVEGNFLTLNLCWGMAVFFSTMLGIGVSGGQTNPSVSLVLWSLGRLTARQVIVYIPIQVFGAFVGTATAYLDYLETLNHYDGGTRTTEGPNATLCFFVSCQAVYASKLACLFDQIVGTAILCCTMSSMLDPRNGIPKCLHPIFGGLTVLTIGLSFAQNDAYPIHAARDLGARLFLFIVYGKDVWTNGNYYWWVPVVGPLIGGYVGAWIYVAFVDLHAWSNGEEKDRQSFLQSQRTPTAWSSQTTIQKVGPLIQNSSESAWNSHTTLQSRV
ncbi:unnamed protein product, partial [Mesorhabditis spiculigera]